MEKDVECNKNNFKRDSFHSSVVTRVLGGMPQLQGSLGPVTYPNTAGKSEKLRKDI